MKTTEYRRMARVVQAYERVYIKLQFVRQHVLQEQQQQKEVKVHNWEQTLLQQQEV